MSSSRTGRIMFGASAAADTWGSVTGLAAVVTVGVTLAVGLMAILHVLDPALDPVERPTSEYAVGPFGYLMTAVFLSLFVATWALIVGLRRDVRSEAVPRVGIGFLAAWSIGLLVAAAFPIDAEGAAATTAGTVHAINGPLTFLALVVGMALVSHRLRQDARWRATRRIAWPLSLLTILEFVLAGAARAAGMAGIAQRLLLLTVAAWFLVVAHRLRANARTAG